MTIAGPLPASVVTVVTVVTGRTSGNALLEGRKNSIPSFPLVTIVTFVTTGRYQPERSRYLVHWTNAPPGLYTNTEPSHLFLRLRAERL